MYSSPQNGSRVLNFVAVLGEREEGEKERERKGKREGRKREREREREGKREGGTGERGKKERKS